MQSQRCARADPRQHLLRARAVRPRAAGRGRDSLVVGGAPAARVGRRAAARLRCRAAGLRARRGRALRRGGAARLRHRALHGVGQEALQGARAPRFRSRRLPRRLPLRLGRLALRRALAGRRVRRRRRRRLRRRRARRRLRGRRVRHAGKRDGAAPARGVWHGRRRARYWARAPRAAGPAQGLKSAVSAAAAGRPAGHVRWRRRRRGVAAALRGGALALALVGAAAARAAAILAVVRARALRRTQPAVRARLRKVCVNRITPRPASAAPSKPSSSTASTWLHCTRFAPLTVARSVQELPPWVI